HLIHQRRLAVVHVGDDRNIPNIRPLHAVILGEPGTSATGVVRFLRSLTLPARLQRPKILACPGERTYYRRTSARPYREDCRLRLAFACHHANAKRKRQSAIKKNCWRFSWTFT